MGTLLYNKGRVVLLSVFALLLSSCVTMEQDLLYLNDQVKALNERVGRLEETMDAKLSKDLESRLKGIRENQADLVNDMNNVKGEVQVLSGRVEENLHLTKRAIERDTTEQDLMKAGFTELKERVARLETRVSQISAYVGLESSGEGIKKPVEAAPVPAKEPETPEPKPVVAEEKPVSPEKAQYEATLKAYQQGKYEAAIAGFEGFLKKHPKSDLADNAQFWIGECYMALKQYEKAILAYQEVIKKYPKANKVPNALLRQALAFYEINDKTSSRLLLKKIIKKYPESSEAKIAKAKLEKMK